MMTVRRPGFALVGVLLALAAMLGVLALASWHSAMVNDADPVHAVSVRHLDGAPGEADPDGSLHVVAHATGQFLSVASLPATPVFSAPVARAWAPVTTFFQDDSDPSGLLRPPRD